MAIAKTICNLLNGLQLESDENAHFVFYIWLDIVVAASSEHVDHAKEDYLFGIGER